MIRLHLFCSIVQLLIHFSRIMQNMVCQRRKAKSFIWKLCITLNICLFYVCGISAITRDEAVLRAIAFNARDELGLSKPHADIYRDFLLKKGISEQEINDYQCLPGTQALNDGIRALYSTPPLQKALGALFADEAMSASMVAQYNDGLIKEGLSERDRSFWILHMEVEVGHSNAIFNVMEPHLESQAEQLAFVDGINQYMHLMEVYWDGIASKIQGLQHHA